jgi:hypothetical protein
MSPDNKNNFLKRSSGLQKKVGPFRHRNCGYTIKGMSILLHSMYKVIFLEPWINQYSPQES